ncbi:MAG: glutamate-5-semialdehyde dehydrogenase [Phycisphaerae bacterium]|nr:glutamate-5-semialdehyde dehydrogenase [Phycisphaerae bacterium]
MTDRITHMAAAAKAASRIVATLDTETKRTVLRAVASAVDAKRPDILHANAEDLEVAHADGLADAKLQRLGLDDAKLDRLCEGVRQIAGMADPVGAQTMSREVPSGLRVRKVRAPLGVIAMIYEARPAVTIDAFALCFMSGNACILKGGREANRSNHALAEIARAVLSEHGAPADAMNAFTSSEREDLRHLLSLSDSIDLVIPRGGEALIRFVAENSRIPTIQHYKGVCHAYIDEHADIEMAANIVVTAKTSAPATCNALECALVHEAVAPAFLKALGARIPSDMKVRAEAHVIKTLDESMTWLESAKPDDWGREYLDTVLALRIVTDMDQALEHIATYSSSHTECIVTNDASAAERFCREVQSSCVLVNASTRFNDGFELGLGAEIGISTSRIHAYGPMGLEELTTQRYVVTGTGQTR